MIIPAYTREQFRIKAHHEAGHFVVARALDFKTEGISLTVTDMMGGHIGSAVIKLDRPFRTIEEIFIYSERRLQVLYAGGLAEAMSNGVIDNTKLGRIWNTSGKSDCDKARELIRIIRGIKHPESITEEEMQKDLDSVENEYLNKAGKLVLKYEKLIYGIGGQLFEGVKEFKKEYSISEDTLNQIPNLRDLIPEA